MGRMELLTCSGYMKDIKGIVRIDLKEKGSIQSFIIKYDLVVRFLYLPFIRLMKFPCIPSSLIFLS